MGRRAIFSVVDILLVLNTDNKSYHSFIGDYIVMPECSQHNWILKVIVWMHLWLKHHRRTDKIMDSWTNQHTCVIDIHYNTITLNDNQIY